MLTFFKICFGVGLGYAVLGFILGHIFSAFDIGGDSGDIDLDFGGHTGGDFGGHMGGDLGGHMGGDFGGHTGGDFGIHGDGHLDMGTHNISPLKPACIAAFITVLGGSGMLFYPNFGPLLSLMAGSTLGLFTAFLMFRLVIVPLNNAQNTSAVEIQSLIGHDAVVTEKIPQGGFGKITYRINGNIYSAPSRSEDGHEILRNTYVEIAHIEKNTYFVAPKTSRN